MPQEDKKWVVDARGNRVRRRKTGAQGSAPAKPKYYVPKGKEGDSRYKTPGISRATAGTAGQGMDPRNVVPMPLNDAHVKAYEKQKK